MIKLKWRRKGLIRREFSEWESAGPDLRTIFTGPIGARSLTPAARDVVRVGLAVHAIERALPPAPGGNRPTEFEVSLHLEEPGRWTAQALDALEELLRLQGDATWGWKMYGQTSSKAAITFEAEPQDRVVNRVALFSGGLDSTCGIASCRADASSVQLVSHYSRQKKLQLQLTEQLEYGPPTQIRTKGARGRGRNFCYRSFYYLCLAAAVASTYDVRRIVQYENGILATAMPPSPVYFMTRHAHPFVHRAAERVFNSVLGGEWEIENPFLKRTKRECYEAMVAQLGAQRAAKVAAQTETCWYQYSNQYLGGRKKDNGIACGVCIPCIVRRPATPKLLVAYDLKHSAVRSDPVLSVEFEAYREFARRARDPDKRTRLLLELPSYVRGLMRGESAPFSRDELADLVDRFGREFRDVFGA